MLKRMKLNKAVKFFNKGMKLYNNGESKKALGAFLVEDNSNCFTFKMFYRINPSWAS